MTRGARPGAIPLLVVAAGAAAGALVRWSLAHAVAGSDVWPILAINVVGCFLLGALPAVLAGHQGPHLPLLLGPGFLGGFTTVSTWTEQSRELAADGDVSLAGLYIAATLVACGVAAVAGRRLACPRRGQEP